MTQPIFKRVLCKYFKIYALADMDDRLLNLAFADDDELQYPPQVLRIETVPYVDGEIMTLFDFYSTLEEAMAEILKIAPVDNTEYVILPVYQLKNERDYEAEKKASEAHLEFIKAGKA